MNPTRRGFLGLIPALVAGTTTYFDMGTTWQRHGDLWLLDAEGNQASTIETWPIGGDPVADMVWPDPTFENLDEWASGDYLWHERNGGG